MEEENNSQVYFGAVGTMYDEKDLENTETLGTREERNIFERLVFYII